MGTLRNKVLKKERKEERKRDKGRQLVLIQLRLTVRSLEHLHVNRV